MFKKKNLFKTTFILSLVLHALFFLPLPKLNFIKDTPTGIPATSYMNISISPVKNTQLQAQKNLVSQNPLPEQNIHKLKTPQIKLASVRKIKHKGRKPAKKNIAVNKIKKSKPVITKKETPAKELSKNKSYLLYDDLITAKLRNSKVYPATFSEGEISVSFVVGSDGRLISVEVLPDNSTGNSILSETAVKIVKNASPFPPFPDDLLRMQLRFSVVICFQGNS